MPKDKTSNYSRLRHFVSEFGDEVFSIGASILFCKLCECKVNSDKKFNVTQHLKTDKHLKAIKREQNKIEKKQQLLTNIPQKCTFNIDLCKTLISANIPLNKLSIVKFRQFLEKYTKNHIPDESTLRKLYVDDIYKETIEKIRSQVANNRIWVSIDETTDVKGRFIANVIIGTLEIEHSGSIFLFHSEQLEKTNFSTITRQCTIIFIRRGTMHEKAGKSLKVFYSKMLHVTCAAHGLHRIAEQVRDHFSTVDKVIANCKKVFKKAPTRVEIFKIEAPGICLPPDPILTRWGSWINVAIYYCENLSAVRGVIEKLDEDDAVSIKKTKKYIVKPGIESNLAYIKSNFTILVEGINKLQTKSLSLITALKIIEDIEKSFKSLRGEAGTIVKNKFKTVFENNNGLTSLKRISKILSGEEENSELDGDLEELTSDDIVFFKYSPITSVDVERSFSTYKSLLTDNRRNFKFENLAKHLIIQCNSDNFE
ncbi:hypothetical protein AGLY_018079 [Aphis glycines]|uniref:Uncharacterized protein n=1 Tax=Aphis glycines TaxID=307491 RepID=A0A6G0ST37_APHGL|nr:hypothetical protein AGLY_018079 [Aphis glycines]